MAWRRLACVLLGIVLSIGGGCQGTAAVPQLRGRKKLLRSTASAPPALRQAMEGIARRLQELGLKPVAGLSLHDFIADGGRSSQVVEVPAERCLTLVAVATAGVGDIDASLYSVDGDVLATDAQPDPQPAVQVCGGATPSRVYYLLRAYEGAGTFLVQGFVGADVALESTLATASPKPVRARSPTGDNRVDQRMRLAEQTLRRLGLTAMQPPVHVAFDGIHRVGMAVEVQPGKCYAITAFAVDGTEAIALRLLDATGTELQLERASATRPVSVRFCARQAASYTAETFADQVGAATLLLYQGAAHRVWSQVGGFPALDNNQPLPLDDRTLEPPLLSEPPAQRSQLR